MVAFIKWVIALFCITTIALVFLDTEYKDTRQQLLMNSRLLGANLSNWQKEAEKRLKQWPDMASGDFSVSRAIKNTYIRHAVISSNKTPADVVLKMNQLEMFYHVPYSWGGSIHTTNSGLDCSGFVHGVYYYLGIKGYKGRFTTKSLFTKLERDKRYKKVFDQRRQNKSELDRKKLKEGDIILWPSGYSLYRNLQPKVIGHVGIISHINQDEILVTHYGNSAKFNSIDKASDIKGSGINTIDFNKFIKYKKSGRLVIYQRLS